MTQSVRDVIVFVNSVTEERLEHNSVNLQSDVHSFFVANQKESARFLELERGAFPKKALPTLHNSSTKTSSGSIF
jgi:hypothetical protein